MKYKIIQSLIAVAFVWIFICVFALKFYKYMPKNNRNTVLSNVFVRWLRLPPSRLGHSSELDGSRCSVGCVCNSSETGLKSQMKESKASQRKKYSNEFILSLAFFYVPCSLCFPAVETENMISRHLMKH